MNLFLSKNIELDDKETVVMAILNGLYSNKNENLYISISLLGYAITGRFLNIKNQKDRTIITGIKEGLNSLIDIKPDKTDPDRKRSVFIFKYENGIEDYL